MKTVLRRFIETIEQTHPFPIELKKKWLEMEKRQLCDFWIDGNNKGWAQETDWEEDAINYYNEKFDERE